MGRMKPRTVQRGGKLQPGATEPNGVTVRRGRAVSGEHMKEGRSLDLRLFVFGRSKETAVDCTGPGSIHVGGTADRDHANKHTHALQRKVCVCVCAQG